MMRRARAAVVTLLLLSAACATGGAAARPDPPLCRFIAECVARDGFCIVTQLPVRGAARIRKSEAYGDMASMAAQRSEARGDVHQFTIEGDASRYLAGVPRSARLRTIFVGRGGRSIEADGLFVDDLTPIAAQFDGTASPADLPAELRQGKVRANPSTCRG